ncbi:MAG: hypothetical protein ABIO51_01455, partial [Solirubrobacteraceae bacterium]
RAVRVTVLAIGGFALVAAVMLLAVGPSAMDLLFGDLHSYGRGGLALLVSRVVEDFRLSIPLPTMAALLVLAAFAGVFASVIPARRAAKLDVLRALAYE